MANERNCPTTDCETVVQVTTEECCNVWDCPNCSWRLEIETIDENVES